MTCILCRQSKTTPLERGRDGRRYHRCEVCDLYFLDPADRLSSDGERARYDLHTHDPADLGYQRFVTPLVEHISRALPMGSGGLDFGAGRVPTLSRLLEDAGFSMSIYDAFYWPDPAPLNAQYDFVVSCEVIEHLYDPAFEFARLRAVLKPGAGLFVMTEPRHDGIDFENWAYRRDPTHVAFFSARTFGWIAANFGFKNMEITGRVISLFTPGG